MDYLADFSFKRSAHSPKTASRIFAACNGL